MSGLLALFKLSAEARGALRALAAIPGEGLIRAVNWEAIEADLVGELALSVRLHEDGRRVWIEFDDAPDSGDERYTEWFAAQKRAAADLVAQNESPELRAALDRYWNAKSMDEQRAAYNEARALGLPASYGVWGREVRYEDAASIDLRELELSSRAENVLRKILGAVTVADVASITEAELMRQPNFGKVSLVEVRGKLASIGLRIGHFAGPYDRMSWYLSQLGDA